MSIDRVLEECNRRIAQSLSSNSQQVSFEAYQEHARGTDNALEHCRSHLVAQEKKMQDGETHLRRLQGEIADLSRQRDLRASEEMPPNRDPELAIRLAQLEEGPQESTEGV